MAPVDMFHRLKSLYSGQHDKTLPRLPAISATNAALLSIVFTLIYVLPFYISKSTRPSPSLNRDAPSVIRARIQTVTVACIVASVSTLYLLVGVAKAKPLEAIHLLGWWPIKPLEFIKSCSLVLLLYTGPLFEVIFIEKDLRGFRGWEQTVATLSSWSGYRNYSAGPLTEEVIFRSVIIPLHLIADISASKIVFLTPLYFGIAHVHHLYEFKLTHPHTPWLPAILRSIFQFGYTTLFGWFASFLYIRTGSIYAGVLVHSFCNWGGLPRFWGRPHRRVEYAATPIVVRRKDDGEMPRSKAASPEVSNAWAVAYYVLLVVGAYAFYVGFWPLTESTQALATFGSPKKKS